MQPHQQKVVEEKTELDKKATALSEFIGNSPIFKMLNAVERYLLKKQNDVMWTYSRILGARIAAWRGMAQPSANRCWSEPADALGMAALLVSEAKRSDRPRAWLCEMVQEDGTTRTQFMEEDPEGLRWNDAGETSPYRTTPLYALTTKQVSLVSGA